MNSGPWWSTPVFTLGGVALTLLVTVWLDHRRGRRESRHRWAERKMELYSEFLDACDDLRDIPVWPAERGADPQATTRPFTLIRRAARRAAYPASAEVRASIADVVRAARALAVTMAEIRSDSNRGHQGAVDARLQPRIDEAHHAFDDAVDAFDSTSRKDIDITDPIPAERTP